MQSRHASVARHPVAAALLVGGGAAALSGLITAPLALAAGILLVLVVGNPWAKRTGKWAGLLLRACVVGLGFGMSARVVVDAAERGLGYTVAGVLVSFAGGLLLGRLLRVQRDASLLISSGTSICGGSAIAAVGSAIRAPVEALSAALGIIFVLNAAALYLFPLIGHALDLTQTQFAIWAAVAIHDTSSVVAAAGLYGEQALHEATVLKLARTLWLIPLVLGAAWTARRRQDTTEGPAGVERDVATRAAVQFPWFPLLFLLAVVVRSVAPAELAPQLDALARLARRGLPLVLFLVGSSLTVAALRAFGVRPFLQAVLLWLGMAAGVLAAVLMLAN